MPHIRTIIDIGGQDSKVIVLDKNGNVANFVISDKWAVAWPSTWAWWTRWKNSKY